MVSGTSGMGSSTCSGDGKGVIDMESTKLEPLLLVLSVKRGSSSEEVDSSTGRTRAGCGRSKK